MKKTVIEEIRENMIPDPDRWEQIRAKAKIASAHYREVIASKKRSGEEIIHFAAYVTNKAMYGMHDVFCAMLADRKRWDPKVVILPRSVFWRHSLSFHLFLQRLLIPVHC